MTRYFSLVACLVLAVSLAFGTSSQVQAWGHGCHSFGHGGYHSWGAYGMGGGFRSTGFGRYCSSYYSPRFCSYSSYSFPSYYSYSSCYSPFYNSSYYCSPVVYRPVLFSPIIYSRPCVTPVFYPLPQVPLCVSNSPAAPTFVAAPKFVATPARESWLTSAVELIDLMVEQGGVEEGLQACEQLIKVRDQLPSEIYWRAATLASLGGRDARQIIEFVDRAEKAGDRFDGQQFPGGSLRAYAKTAKGTTVDETLNRLAKAAMTSANPSAEYRSLSAILTLDGQSSRARVFLAAAMKPSAATSTQVASLASLNN